MTRRKNDSQWNGILTFVGILLLAGIVYYGGTHGWFKFSITNNITNQDLIDRLENPPLPTSECSATISPSTIVAGQTVTGIVRDGKNTFCEVYGIMEGTPDWRKIAEGTTGSDGTVTFSEPFSVVGTFRFRAVCGDCITNLAILTVTPTPDVTPCTDTDGKNKMVPGHAIDGTGTYYDNCAGNWAVIEYYCNGNTVVSEVIACDAGYICFETRSGDYCKTTMEPTTTTVLPSSYTCGISEWCPSGSCPDGYSCEQVDNLVGTWCACIDPLGNVHSDWKPGAPYYHIR